MKLFRWFEVDRTEKFPKLQDFRECLAVHQWLGLGLLVLFMILLFLLPILIGAV
jgi:Fe2+ transport system protein B